MKEENPYNPLSASIAPEIPTRRGADFFIKLCVVAVLLFVLVGLMLPAVRTARPAARRMQCANNLKQISLAILNYHEKYGSFPPAFTVDDEGNRLHSWRTLILPFMEQSALYDTIDLSVPWSDPANHGATKASVPAYHCPESNTDSVVTRYLAVVGENCPWHPTLRKRLSDFIDAEHRLAIVIEAPDRDAVHWMSPNDYNELQFLAMGKSLEPAHPYGYHIAHIDGSVSFLSNMADDEARRSMIHVEAQ
jgi:hypothetical protein